MSVFLIILLVVIFLVLLLLIDFHLGRKKHLSKVKKTTFQQRLGQLTLFTDGQDLFDDLFQEIQQAKHHVHILFYIVKKDKISKRFLTLLKKKASEGVEVRLLLDWIGSMGISKKTIASLKKSGVKFSFCHIPKPPYFFYTTQERNHRKITVIDGEVGYLGGFNVGKEYINGDPKLSPWRDYHLKITGESVQDIETTYLSDWLEATGEDIKYKEVYIKQGKKGVHLHQLFPTEGAFLEEEFINLVRTAKQSIIIGTPYFIPSDRLMFTLRKAIIDGVSLRIIVPYTADHLLVKEASFPYFRELLSLGAKVYQYQNGFFHAKYILIDDTILDIGTANFDKRSLFLNHEINCFIYDKQLISSMKLAIQEDIQNSTELSLTELNKMNVWRSAKEKLAAALSPFL